MDDPVVFTGAASEPGNFTGFINPAVAAKAFVKAMGVPMDETSFDRVAEQCGNSAPDELAKGFLINTYEDVQRLCDLGQFCIFTHAKTGLVTALYVAGVDEVPQVVIDSMLP